jgi:hypothetical protein
LKKLAYWNRTITRSIKQFTSSASHVTSEPVPKNAQGSDLCF